MRGSYLIRIAFLVLILAVVIAVIRGMSAPNVEGALDALGLSPGTAESPGVEPGGRALGPGDERLTLCKTRIQSMSWRAPGETTEFKLEEIKDGLKGRWMSSSSDPQHPAQNAGPHEIGYMEVETWLSHHCQAVVHPIDPGRLTSEKPAQQWEIHFVDQTVSALMAFDVSSFSLDQHVFKSVDLRQALDELSQLAGWSESAGGAKN